MGVNFLLCSVVWTNFLTNITAVEEFGFFDNFGECRRNFVFIFDGEIGDTETRINNSRSNNRSGGALIDAFCTLAAEMEFWLWRLFRF